MTFTVLSTVIALIVGWAVGTAVTIMWEWGRFRKVHRRYKGVR